MNQPPASEEKFDRMVEHEDVSSISGSESENDDESNEEAGQTGVRYKCRLRRDLTALSEGVDVHDGDEGGASRSRRVDRPEGQVPQFMFRTQGEGGAGANFCGDFDAVDS